MNGAKIEVFEDENGVPAPPKRRLKLTLDLDADDLDGIYDALRSIATDTILDGREEREITSGGCDSGYHLNLTVQDAAMTGDRFRTELAVWMATRKEARRERS